MLMNVQIIPTTATLMRTVSTLLVDLSVSVNQVSREMVQAVHVRNKHCLCSS